MRSNFVSSSEKSLQLSSCFMIISRVHFQGAGSLTAELVSFQIAVFTLARPIRLPFQSLLFSLLFYQEEPQVEKYWQLTRVIKH